MNIQPDPDALRAAREMVAQEIYDNYDFGRAVNDQTRWEEGSAGDCLSLTGYLDDPENDCEIRVTFSVSFTVGTHFPLDVTATVRDWDGTDIGQTDTLSNELIALADQATAHYDFGRIPRGSGNWYATSSHTAFKPYALRNDNEDVHTLAILRMTFAESPHKILSIQAYDWKNERIGVFSPFAPVTAE